jgi:hypothetical protein
MRSWKTKVKFRPLHDRVVVRRSDVEEKTAGGIIIPDTAKEKPQQGEIVAMDRGPAATMASCSLSTSNPAIGSGSESGPARKGAGAILRLLLGVGWLRAVLNLGRRRLWSIFIRARARSGKEP